MYVRFHTPSSQTLLQRGLQPCDRPSGARHGPWVHLYHLFRSQPDWPVDTFYLLLYLLLYILIYILSSSICLLLYIYIFFYIFFCISSAVIYANIQENDNSPHDQLWRFELVDALQNKLIV
jgi:hypothetical protein